MDTETQAILTAVISLITALAAYFARPKVDAALERRKVRKAVEAKTDPPVTPPEIS